jgi:uncharacterized protein YbjQ (UPF0145 family)
MKKTITTMLVFAAIAAAVAPAQASNNKVLLPIDAAMDANDAKAKLGDSGITFHFAGQPMPKVISKRGSDKTSQKTNAFGKSAEKACNWAFLSAMLRFEKRAQELGANAVINITSNYDNVEFSSATEYECHVGGIMAGAAFKADFAKIAK